MCKLYKRILILGLSLSLVMSTLCGCGKSNNPLVGEWAYIHDPETTVLNLKDNGKADFKGQTFSYELKDGQICLKDENGKTTDLRYEENKDGFLLYEHTTYEYEGSETPSSIVGRWVDPVNKWSFEFTDQGTFSEDGYFPGYYTVNDDGKSVKLVYNDHFEDTTVYYTIDGNTLKIEYPWQMVKHE